MASKAQQHRDEMAKLKADNAYVRKLTVKKRNAIKKAAFGKVISDQLILKEVLKKYNKDFNHDAEAYRFLCSEIEGLSDLINNSNEQRRKKKTTRRHSKKDG